MSKGYHNPIPDDSSKDRREPLNYRGINLSSCVYILYCLMLNGHMGKAAKITCLLSLLSLTPDGMPTSQHTWPL